MGTLGRTTFLLHIPVTLLLVLWAWLGRILFGIGGWWLMILPLLAGPWILLALALAEGLVFTRPQRPRGFTRWECVSLFALWLGLAGVGFFLVDFGDTPGSEASVLSELAGRDMLGLSTGLATVSGAVTAVAWVALIVQLLVDRARVVSAAVSTLHGHDTAAQR